MPQYICFLTFLTVFVRKSESNFCSGKKLVFLTKATEIEEMVVLADVSKIMLSSPRWDFSVWVMMKQDGYTTALFHVPYKVVDWELSHTNYLCSVSPMQPKEPTVCERATAALDNFVQSCSSLDFKDDTIPTLDFVTNTPIRPCGGKVLGVNVRSISNFAAYYEKLMKFCGGCSQPPKVNKTKLIKLEDGEAIVIQGTTRYTNGSGLRPTCEGSGKVPSSNVTCVDGQWSAKLKDVHCIVPNAHYREELEKKTKEAFVSAMIFITVPLVLVIAGLAYMMVSVRGDTKRSTTSR